MLLSNIYIYVDIVGKFDIIANFQIKSMETWDVM
jgi:hypothetical protein